MARKVLKWKELDRAREQNNMKYWQIIGEAFFNGIFYSILMYFIDFINCSQKFKYVSENQVC